MFGNKKEKSAKPSALEELRKAYEALSDDDKETFKQTITEAQEPQADPKQKGKLPEGTDGEQVPNAPTEDEEVETEETEEETETDEESETADVDEEDADTTAEKAETAAKTKHAEATAPTAPAVPSDDEGDEGADLGDKANGGVDLNELSEYIKALEERIAKLEEEAESKAPKKASEEETDYLTSLERKYNN